ncbi:aliphatic sulfonate ABC transporter substrate-binding protein [Mycobacterium sp. KBS0706]|uniref:aliphatic sulfonate ABC transporter substrate-binding protein n=1 Tax=Mycobacterium sp. KBS0706 TaxID=2578109 RepID=UPI00110F9EAA|nr:aliphatic sulfonate ABC transporter substrate-binding protein [Mycobacterium sp. KBS0706]TSD84831.1 aliphatic sulfonate ABC transporter substrate-binding protein [Mycobacterium sp. KBS0706]
MITLSRRLLLAGSIVVAALAPAAGRAADPVSAITLDWAYYSPVSLVLKDKGWLEEALKPQGVSVTWVQSAGSNKAIEFLNSGSVQFGSTAGAAALLARINGSPIKAVYSYSRPEWTALVTNGDSPIQSVEDLKGKRVAVTRGTDPYIFLLRALADHGLAEQDIEVVLLQHADGRNALIGHQVDAWAGLDPMMAQAELEQGARLFYRKPELNTYGVLNVNEQFAADHPEIVETVIRAYEQARTYALAHPEELRAALVQAAGLTDAVAARQLERTDLSGPAIDASKHDTILNAGLALQKAGVIDSGVDVAATVDALLDARFKTALAN